MNTFGSLFAGVGGFDMGFEQAGYTCLFQVEWDKHCQSVLNRYWPNVPKWGDVCEVSGTELPPVDVLIFGSPCQDLSVAGKRAGIDGGRSSMFFEATRIIKEMRNATGNTYPRVVVWENVPGALSSNRGADFQVVLNQMGDCGSHLTEWAVLDAQHFGVPQRRRRIFLVAVLDPAIATRCPDPLFPVAEGRRGDYEKGLPKGKEIARTLAESFRSRQSTAVKAKRAMSNIDDDRWEETDLSPTLNAFDNGSESRATVLAFTAQRVGEAPRIYEDSTPALLSRMGTGGNNTPMVVAFSAGNSSNSYGIALTEDGTPPLRAGASGTNQVPTIAFGWQENYYAGDTHDEITTALTTTKTPAVGYYESGPGFILETDQAGALRAEGENRPSRPTHTIVQDQYVVRRLTPLECERLMGWPDDHTRWRADGTEQSDSARYKQCGNGVATPVARWVAQQIGGIL